MLNIEEIHKEVQQSIQTIEIKRKRGDATRGKTYEERYGESRAKEIKLKISLHSSRERKPCTEEAKKKLSLAHMGKKHTEESKKKISIAKQGQSHPHTEESKKKLSLAHTGKKHTKEHIENSCKALKGRISPRKGVTLSDETKNKIRAARAKQVIKHSPETKEKLRQARLRQVLPTKDTSIEIALQTILTENNFEFQKHKSIYGQPDIFIEPNLCIFADGDYWHNYPIGNPRDKKVTNFLQEQGYVVLRFWERDIRKNIDMCLKKIISAYDSIGYYYVE